MNEFDKKLFEEVKLYLRLDGCEELYEDAKDAMYSAKEYLANAGVKEQEGSLYKRAVKILASELFDRSEEKLGSISISSIINQLRAKNGSL